MGPIRIVHRGKGDTFLAASTGGHKHVRGVKRVDIVRRQRHHLPAHVGWLAWVGTVGQGLMIWLDDGQAERSGPLDGCLTVLADDARSVRQPVHGHHRGLEDFTQRGESEARTVRRELGEATVIGNLRLQLRQFAQPTLDLITRTHECDAIHGGHHRLLHHLSCEPAVELRGKGSHRLIRALRVLLHFAPHHIEDSGVHISRPVAREKVDVLSAS
eukprot:scaffold158828_cov32-Tisochrysis_lutea.AAC.6